MGDTPELHSVRAIDIVPYHAALWCSIGDGEPFANEIVGHKWADDGSDTIWFMLDSHNCFSARAEEMVECIVVGTRSSLPVKIAEEQIAKHSAFVARRPNPKVSSPAKIAHQSTLRRTTYWWGGR